MHPAAREMLLRWRHQLSGAFVEKKVLDVGSGDINGNNRFLFERCEYTGIDVAPGPNVDVVCRAKDFRRDEVAVYDTIISTECFEHDQEYIHSLQNIVRLLKPGGLLVFTCASFGRGEHGTPRTSPKDSLSSQLTGDWNPSYYKNLSIAHVIDAMDVYSLFDRFSFEFSRHDGDLYFWGIRA